MSNKKQIKILNDIKKQLSELPAHDMAIGAAIFCVGQAIQHLQENNHKAKIMKGGT